ISGYARIINTVYSPKHYYDRVKTFLKEYRPPQKKLYQLRLSYVGAFLKSMMLLGVVGKERVHYWRLFFWTMFRRPRLVPMTITFAIYGFHFRKVFEKYLVHTKERVPENPLSPLSNP
ncbi:MAG: DUF4070 domain-containing protein, partial [Thermodesulfovibrionales bacterium]